jgi:hypothetical protein
VEGREKGANSAKSDSGESLSVGLVCRLGELTPGSKKKCKKSRLSPATSDTFEMNTKLKKHKALTLPGTFF